MEISNMKTRYRLRLIGDNKYDNDGDDVILYDLGGCDKYDDFYTLGQARQCILDNYDEICRIAMKWVAEYDSFNLAKDYIKLEIQEITTIDESDDFDDNCYDCAELMTIYKDRQGKQYIDIIDFEKMYKSLNIYQQNTLLALSYYGGYDIVDDLGLLSGLYYGDYNISLSGDDLLNIKNTTDAVNFYDKYTNDDKENGILNHTFDNSVDTDYQVAKDYHKCICDCVDELINSCNEKREYDFDKVKDWEK